MQRRLAMAVLIAMLLPVITAAECAPTKMHIKGTINHGNYEFEYESWQGEHCRQYRLRNSPGKPLTPVKWTYGEVVFIDTNLPACGEDEDCRVAEKVDYSIVPSQMKTTIGFGINKDQYIENPAAVVESDVVSALSEAFPSEFSGFVADAEGVTSNFSLTYNPIKKTDEGRWLVQFTASQQSAEGTSSEPIRVIWEDANEMYFEGSFEPGSEAVWTFQTLPSAASGRGGTATLTMLQGEKVIATTTTPVPESSLQ